MLKWNHLDQWQNMPFISKKILLDKPTGSLLSKKRNRIKSIDEDVEKLELLCTGSGNVKCDGYYEKQNDSFSKN